MTVRTDSRSSLLATAIVLRHPGQTLGLGTSSSSRVATPPVSTSAYVETTSQRSRRPAEPATGECEQQVDERAEGEAAERYAGGEQPVVVRLVERAEEPEVAHCREQVAGAVLGSAPQREETARDEGDPRRDGERDRRRLVVLVVAREHEQDRDARERQPERGGCRQEDGARAQPNRSASAAPLSSAFAMKPRAPLCAISPP